jgi:succinate dehydrogenase/fumarate reductase-like Fe-S protein
VFRFNPRQGETEGRFETYAVPIVERGTSVLNVLQYISEHCDGGLAYYASCRRGECAGCSLRVNGKVRLACLEIVDGDLVLEPVARERVVKDLLVTPGPQDRA